MDFNKFIPLKSISEIIVAIAGVSGSGKSSMALHQRPGVPGIRSTFGTGTELLNSLRLMSSA